MTSSTEAAANARARPRTIPEFFIVGQPKSGTTALYEMLRYHPQIYMPELKEPWFLASDMLPRFQPARSGSTPVTLDGYLALFDAASPGQRAGEASSSYLSSSTAAASIAQLRPDARIIAILREPASFLRSLHLQLLQDHVETEKDLGTALSLEAERREGRSIPKRSHLPQLLMYSNHVRYVELLRRYHAVFAPEQILVLIHDDFQRENEATVRRVYRFLDVDDSVPIEVTSANVTTRRMRSHQLDELVNGVSVGRGPMSRAAKAGLKALMPSERLRRSALQTARQRLVYGQPPPPDEALMLELRRRFRGEVAALGEYLDRDLVSLWGYDGLG
jgi:hypothetical protein